jgi:ribosomal protein L37AE/L43A
MKADDFSVWFSGVGRLSAEQRREVAAALANLDGGLRRAGETETSAAGGATDKGAKRGRRPDALGTSGHERVASQGCPHCAGRAIVAWRRSHGLLRFRCKSCGRTFNGLTKTPMAHLHKRERWFDHARR